jgi:hypothetical protein
MYEEQEVDLPMQYRRLAVQLQNQNPDFDRRLAAYLSNHVAMRSAVGQAVSDAWKNNQFNAEEFMNPETKQRFSKMMQMTQAEILKTASPGSHRPATNSSNASEGHSPSMDGRR